MDEQRDAAVADELRRREAMWRRLIQLAPNGQFTSKQLDNVGIRPFKTGQGIYRDQGATQVIASEGVTLSLLDTGTAYEDSFDDDAGEYHFPATNRKVPRDANEINATKNAGRLALPVFVILKGATLDTREVRRGWIETWDDERKVFLVGFREPRGSGGLPEVSERFSLVDGARPRRKSTAAQRPGQARFRFRVLRRCGRRCMVCDLRVEELLEAAHVCSVEEGGSDDPRNGVVLCRNHHRAFDATEPFFAIEPASLRVVPRKGFTLEVLGITRDVISEREAPHAEALQWSWQRFAKSKST